MNASVGRRNETSFFSAYGLDGSGNYRSRSPSLVSNPSSAAMTGPAATTAAQVARRPTRKWTRTQRSSTRSSPPTARASSPAARRLGSSSTPRPRAKRSCAATSSMTPRRPVRRTRRRTGERVWSVSETPCVVPPPRSTIPARTSLPPRTFARGSLAKAAKETATALARRARVSSATRSARLTRESRSGKRAMRSGRPRRASATTRTNAAEAFVWPERTPEPQRSASPAPLTPIAVRGAAWGSPLAAWQGTPRLASEPRAPLFGGALGCNR